MTRGRGCLTLGALVAVAACHAADAPAPLVDLPAPVDIVSPYWPDSAWRRATPAAAQMDGDAVARIERDVRGGLIPGLHSLLIVRGGWLVSESYLNGATAGERHTLQSISKSVTSLLVGIALDRGALPSVDVPVLSLFPEYRDLPHVDEHKRALRVRDLLAMRTGMAFWESPYAGSPLQQLNDCRCDWYRFVLSQPMREAPDQRWSYNSGGAVLLGGVVRAATSRAVDDFATEALFAPLGIHSAAWYRNAGDGTAHTGGGLLLASRDLARIGWLLVRDGVWNGRPVVSSAWLALSTSRATTGTERYFPRATDYGLLWWLFPRNGVTGPSSGDDYIIAASGTGGQWLFVDRRHALVVVFTSALSGGSWPAIDLVFGRILPAVR